MWPATWSAFRSKLSAASAHSRRHRVHCAHKDTINRLATKEREAPMGILDRILPTKEPKAKTLADTRKTLESARHAAQIAHGTVLELEAAHAATEDEDAVMRILAKKDIAARKHAIAATALALAEDEHAAAELAERKRIAKIAEDKSDAIRAQWKDFVQRAIDVDRQAYQLNEAFMAHHDAHEAAIAELNRLNAEAGERADFAPDGAYEMRQHVRARVLETRIAEGRRSPSNASHTIMQVANLLHLDQLG
ncbi:MAG: hypothetical protein HOO96_35990 [Polyangiaceae bacterium]|nr:hypothetical protein [Polyangiaceae bacterium]